MRQKTPKWSKPVKRRDFAHTFLSGLSASGLTQYLTFFENEGKGGEMTSEVEMVENINELRQLAPRNDVVLFVLGYHEPYDGGGGIFRWQSDDTSEPDGGTIFSSTSREDEGQSSVGRWHRIFQNEALNVLWFGARRDDSTDAAPAIQAALKSVARFNDLGEYASRPHPEAGYHGTVYLPRGTYQVERPISVEVGGLRIVGDGAHSTILRASGEMESAKAMIEIVGTDYKTVPGPIRRLYCADFGIRGRGTKPEDEPTGIIAREMNGWMFERLDLRYLNYGLDMTGSWMGELQNVYATHTHKGSIINDVSHNVSIIACRFLQTEASGKPGLRIRGCSGFSIVSTNFEGSDVGLFMDDGIRGASVSGCFFEAHEDAHIHLEGQPLDIEEEKERGIEGVSITGNFFNNAKGKTVEHHAIYIRGNDDHPVTGLHIAGNYIDGETNFAVYFELEDGNYALSSFSISGNSLDTPNPAELTNLSPSEEQKTGWQGFARFRH